MSVDDVDMDSSFNCSSDSLPLLLFVVVVLQKKTTNQCVPLDIMILKKMKKSLNGRKLSGMALTSSSYCAAVAMYF